MFLHLGNSLKRCTYFEDHNNTFSLNFEDHCKGQCCVNFRAGISVLQSIWGTCLLKLSICLCPPVFAAHWPIFPLSTVCQCLWKYTLPKHSSTQVSMAKCVVLECFYVSSPIYRGSIEIKLLWVNMDNHRALMVKTLGTSSGISCITLYWGPCN